MELLAKPSWEKEELPQSVTPKDGTQQGLLQVTSVLALRSRDRGESGDTWRNRSRPSRESSGRPGRGQGSPDPGGEPALMGAGAGLEKAWSLADEGADGSLANRGRRPGVLKKVHPESGEGPGVLGLGAGDSIPYWGGGPMLERRRSCLPTRIKVGAGDMTRKVLFPGPERAS